MTKQSELFSDLVAVVFEYVAALKQQVADAVASDKAKDEVITQKNEEAVEARQMYEDYMSIDISEDEALLQAMDTFRGELEATKQA